MDLLADVRAARELWRVLRTERPDVLHTHTPKPGFYGRILGRLARVPRVVHTTHGLWATPDDRLAKRAVVYGMEAVASRFSHVELVQNPEDLDLMARLRIAPRRKLRLLGNGVDLDRFHVPTEAERAEVRAELGIDDGEVVVGFVGRLVAEKGVPELLAAVDRLGPPHRLLLVGPHDPAKPDALSQDVLDAAAAGGAVLTGHREDTHRLYRAMDVFVLPSHREGFPRAAMEASATGVPVVATDIRGCRQVVEPERTGLLVPVRRVPELAAAVESLTADRRAEMGAAARAKAEADFDERRVVERVLASYDASSGA
jgi:glycosyltransferase involved in cell wall biosynthesis